MTDTHDTSKGRPSGEPTVNEQDTVRPVAPSHSAAPPHSAASPRAVTIPRPTEVRPLNALSETPPPVDVESEPTPLLVDDDLIIEDELTNPIDRPTVEPGVSSRPAPLGVKSRFSTAPPKRLSSRLGASTAAPPKSTSSIPVPLQVPPPRSVSPSLLGLRSPLTPKRLSSGGMVVGNARASAPTLNSKPSSSSPPQLELAVDCPSAERLAELGRSHVWLERAATFEAHASASKDVLKKSRLLVLASELYAMAGQVGAARLAAERAAKLGNHLAQRQARQLAQTAGDAKATASFFGLEANTAVTPQTRRHALLAQAEWERWQRKDLLAASRSLEQSAKIAPSDPVPHLMQLARTLGQSVAAPVYRWPDQSAFEALDAATHTVRRLRGETRPKTTTDDDPVPAFLDARRALERRDRHAAASALLELRSQPELERAALWLASALLAPTPHTRRRAVELLQELDARHSTKAVRRSLVARALESGDNESVLKALDADADKEPQDRAFVHADQLALRALCENDARELLLRLTRAGMSEDEQPIFTAAALAADCAELVGNVGATSAAMVAVSHALGRSASGNTTDGAAPLLALLKAEGKTTRVADTLTPEDLLQLPGLVTPERTGQLSFVAGALSETEGDLPRAQELFTQAVSDPIAGEAALRYILANQDSERASALLESFADRETDPDRQAEVLVQAALLSKDTLRQQSLSARAHAAAPSHVLVEGAVFRFAPHGAVAQGETIPPPSAGESSSPASGALAAKRLAILSHQSISGDHEFIRALALLRHVFAKPSTATRPTLLAHAWDLWPKDLALLELRERHGDLPLEVRAMARETLANSAVGSRSRATLRVEAALFFELAGLPSQAARAAQPQEHRPALLDGCFGRNAPGTEFAASWRQKVAEHAHSAEQPKERAHYWLLAARLASDAGDWAAERESVGRAIHLDPHNIEGLLTAEALAFKDGEIERIADVERYLAETLRAPDNLAHAQFASRFFQLSAGSTSGYAPLCACVDESRTPFEVARRLAYLAPRMGDDDLGYRMHAQLLQNALRPADKAVLLIRCAELALRLGKSGTALTHLEDAIELQPDNVTALSMRAELLANGSYHAAAAEAFERLARTAQSASLRAAGHKRAAEQLLTEAPAPTPDGLPQPSVVPTRPIADPHRLRVNLERALAIAPDDEDVLGQLVELYVRLRLEGELNELFLTRLEVAAPESKQRLLLAWSRACAEMGSTERASELVREVLSQNPDNPHALEQLAKLTPEGSAREQALLQLIRVSPSALQQASAYRQLGDFYRRETSQRTRAVKCYQEAVKRAPEDLELFRVLVDAQIEAEDLDGAGASIGAFAQRATTEMDSHCLAIARAAVAGAEDPAAGESQLLALLQGRPYDGTVITELSQLYLRIGSADKLNALNATTAKHAAAELPNGPHVAQYLSGLASLAKLRADNSAHALIGAISSLYHGTPSGLDARGSRALSKSLDPLLAPLPLVEALRTLLVKTSDAMDEAFPLNIGALNPTPLNEPRLRASFDMKAKAVGIPAPELLLVTSDPYACQVTHRPARVFLGIGWVQSAPSGLQDFIVWRCLKLLQARVGTLAHLSNEAVALRVDALTSAYAEVTGDADLRSAEANRLTTVLRPLLPQDATLGPIALESVRAISQGELQLGDAIALWADRSALLATGEPRTALHAVCLLHGETPETAPGALLAAVGENPAARRLLTSLLDPGVIEAHRSIH